MNEQIHCKYEERWGVLETTLKNIQERLLNHVVEGEKVGGWRDRSLLLEQEVKNLKKEISTIKKGYWLSGILGGIIGGLLSQLTPEVFKFIISLIK